MDRSRVSGAVGFFVCKMVCAMYTGRILVSIVVSRPACHAGDPGSIPGREALFFVVCLLLIALGSTPFALPFVLLSLLFASLAFFILSARSADYHARAMLEA